MEGDHLHEKMQCVRKREDPRAGLRRHSREIEIEGLEIDQQRQSCSDTWRRWLYVKDPYKSWNMCQGKELW